MANRQASKTDNLQPVSQLGLDEFERGVLVILRQFLDTHAKPETQAWQQGYQIAIERWGEPIGLAAAHALSKYIKAVLRFRGYLAFHDPLDLSAREFVTEDEAVLIAVLHYMRRDQTGHAREAIAALTSGQMDTDIIRSGLSFASRFSAGANAQADRRTSTRLHVVE